MKIGIDIGGTSVKGGLVENGEIIGYYKSPTDTAHGFGGIVRSVFKVIDALICDDVVQIGVSSAGDINPFTGEVVFATKTLPEYCGKNILTTVKSRYKIPTFVLNDAMCALLAEMKFGAGQGCKNVVMLTLGTGVGGERAENGRLVLGGDLRGSRLGHIRYGSEGRRCPCGKLDCIETYVSATGLLKTARDLGRRYSDCGELFRGEKGVGAADLFTSQLSDICRMLDKTYPAEVIIIGGGLAHLKEFWSDSFYAKCVGTSAALKIARLGNDAGIIGATLIDENINIPEKK